MNPILMNAILAMDSYNRGYGSGINDSGPNDPDGLGIVGAKVGNATVLNIPLPTGAQAASFYAIAYDYNGGTVISYRGTDDNFNDPLTGWGVGAGLLNVSQAAMAFQFYNSVATGINGGVAIDPRFANISVTGHSMGGGLAGLVGTNDNAQKARKVS